MVMNKAIMLVISLVLAVVGVTIFVSAGPSLVGDMITAVDDSYVSNTTGCYIDEPAGTPDTEVEGFYCTGFGLLPLVIIGLFFAVVISLILGVFGGYLKLPNM